MTIRGAAERLLAHLRPEQRGIPYSGGADFADPSADLVAAMNAALQTICVAAPQFAHRRQMGAEFRAPEEVSGLQVTGDPLVTIQKVGSSWREIGAVGCSIQIDGDEDRNRIVDAVGYHATLQFPHPAGLSNGRGTVYHDAALLPPEVVSVTEPVCLRDGTPIRPANGRWNLRQPVSSLSGDYGRLSRSDGGDQAYFVDSYYGGLDSSGSDLSADRPRLIMTLREAPSSRITVSYQALVAPYVIDYSMIAEIEGEQYIPIPAGFIESIFIPLAAQRFLASPSMQTYDTPGTTNASVIGLYDSQAAAAMELLQNMRPQGRKRRSILPWSR